MQIVFYKNENINNIVQNASNINDDAKGNLEWDGAVGKERIGGLLSSYFLADDSETFFVGQPISEVIFSDFTIQKEREMKIAELDKACEESILSGFTSSNGNHYGYSNNDQVNFVTTKDELTFDETLLVVDLKTENQGVITHTRDEFFDVYKESIQHRKNLQKIFWQKKNEVNASNDVSVIRQITF